MKVYSSTRTRRETLYQRTRDARGSGAGARAQGQGLAVAAAPEACRCSAATCLREGSLPSPRSRVERTWPTGRRIGGTIRGVLIRSAIRGPRPGCPRRLRALGARRARLDPHEHLLLCGRRQRQLFCSRDPPAAEGLFLPRARCLALSCGHFARVADRESGPKCQTDIHVSTFSIHVSKVVPTWVSIRLTWMSVESLRR